MTDCKFKRNTEKLKKMPCMLSFFKFSLTIYYLNATAKGQKAANLDLQKKMKQVGYNVFHRIIPFMEVVENTSKFHVFLPPFSLCSKLWRTNYETRRWQRLEQVGDMFMFAIFFYAYKQYDLFSFFKGGICRRVA